RACGSPASGLRLSGAGLRRSPGGRRLSAFGSRLSALGFRLSAFGSRLSAFGFRLSAFAPGLALWPDTRLTSIDAFLPDSPATQRGCEPSPREHQERPDGCRRELDRLR